MLLALLLAAKLNFVTAKGSLKAAVPLGKDGTLHIPRNNIDSLLKSSTTRHNSRRALHGRSIPRQLSMDPASNCIVTRSRVKPVSMYDNLSHSTTNHNPYHITE